MNKKDINIVITGDFCPEGRTAQICEQENCKNLFNDVLPFIIDSDLSITDLECPLINKPSPIDKTGPNLIAPEKCINLLKYAKFDIATLANNHILDQDKEGLINTIRLCHENGIQTVGAGENLKEAKKPLFLNVKGKTIGIISICENEFSIAQENKSGANPLDVVDNYYAIKDAKCKCDYLLLIFHGGIEHYKYPTPRIVKNLRFFIDAGADAVVSHHTHITSGYEEYNGKPIFYCLGNFIFDRPITFDSWYEGFLLKLRISCNSLKSEFEVIPYEQYKDKLGLLLMKGDNKKKFIKRINEISDVIRNEEKLNYEWKKYIEDKYINQIATFLPFIPRKRKFIKSKRYPKIIKRILLGLYNSISCESLRDICLESFRLLFDNNESRNSYTF